MATTNGQPAAELWPLKLIFILALVGSILLRYDPKLLSPSDTPDPALSGTLFIIAAVSAVLLATPKFIFGWIGLTAQHVTTLDGHVTTLEEHVTTLDGRVTALTAPGGPIATLDGHVTALDGRITALAAPDGPIATLDGHVTALDGHVAALTAPGGPIATLDGRIAGLQDAIATLLPAVNGLRTAIGETGQAEGGPALPWSSA